MHARRYNGETFTRGGMSNKLIGLMYESWADLDRAVSGLTPEEALARHDGGSSIAWTVGHLTHMLDSWIVVRFQGLPPHPVISDPTFRTGGSGRVVGPPAPLDVLQVEYGIESFFVPEGRGRTVEQARDIKVRLAVDSSGNAVIKGLLLDGSPFAP